MREINAQDITAVVKKLCMEANYFLPEDIQDKICKACDNEPWPLAQSILGVIKENYEISLDKAVPICQDTGMACVFLDIGQDVHVNGDIAAAVNEGVRQGYVEGCLRKSVVKDPLDRVNTKDNTPAMIYYNIVPGDTFDIMVAPKGFGSENMSQIKMLKPSDGLQGVKDFVIKCVEDAGPNPCPPIVVGVGIGGTFEKCAQIAKKALLRKVGSSNPDPRYAELEAEILEKINATGVGSQGLGGDITALAVHVEYFPCHIASLPVSVNLNCHAARHAEVTL